MWRCPYCDTEMLRTSRPGHLKNKAGCKEEHAKHLAKEAEKQEELKAKSAHPTVPKLVPAVDCIQPSPSLLFSLRMA